MNSVSVDRAARSLFDARHNGYQLDSLQPDCRPRSLEEAYQIQDRLFDLLGAESVGWFLGGTNGNPKIPAPYAARITKDALVESSARLSMAEFLTCFIDVEFGFTLGHDVTPGSKWTDEEILEAVGSVHPTLDIFNSHFTDLWGVGWPSIVADNGTDGKIVRGPAVSEWRMLNLASMKATLLVNGRVVRTGAGHVIMDDPLKALVWAVRHVLDRGHTLRAGDFFSTGSCTEPYTADIGDRVVAEFANLGAVELTVVE